MHLFALSMRGVTSGVRLGLVRCADGAVTGIYAATTGARWTEKIQTDGFQTRKSLSQKLFTQYTVGSAYAAKEERNIGSLETGKLADLAVLSERHFPCRSGFN